MNKISVLIVCLAGMGCSHPIPKIDIQTWAGDSQKDGISRAQDNQTIECKDPRMDNYVCLSYADLQKIYETFFQCKQWNGALMSHAEERKFYRSNKPVIDKLLHD